ncbi:DUF58 domain-containing protein [Thioclava sp. A2]|uniref:DUF58 domain-containing protein n=1 Tax=Thioclava sp. FCG-A2 TaxID=3080562 RepID=UPI003986544F
MTQRPDSGAALQLRRAAEAQASVLPPLLVAAEQLAATVQLGAHGRRRVGVGEEFWQYRPVQHGEDARFIDWRRSARSDAQYTREREWQLAQSVYLWADDAASMQFAGDGNGPTKAERARLLALALAVLMTRGGERVGLSGPLAPPRPGRAQLLTIAQVLAGASSEAELGAPEVAGISAQSRAVFLSDFFGDLDHLRASVGALADRGVQGVMLQVLAPEEEDFPFQGRTIFESVGGTLRHETRKAADLRARYLDRLAARREALAHLAQTAGWQFSTHHTGSPAQGALLWLHAALGRGA